MVRESGMLTPAESNEVMEAFKKFDKGDKGYLTRTEVQSTIEELTDQEFSMDHIEILYEEFDKDANGKVDIPEFKTMVKYLRSTGNVKKKRMSIGVDDLGSFNGFGKSLTSLGTYGNNRSSDQDLAMSLVLSNAVKASQKDSNEMLKRIAKEIYPVRDMLCIQDDAIFKDMDDGEDEQENMHRSMALDFNDLFGGEFDSWGSFEEEEEEKEPVNTMDPDFESAFSASDMRCLALVSHNGMKKTMREFVVANKNLLKKFRLTGTNSTMTMLKEVFKDEAPGSIVYGPSCASGPLGGDAELVAYMVSGKIGGCIFFQDPMSPHPHRADIDCLVRQGLVHNVVMAETPSSALMICSTLRQALIGKGKPELIPSFFFSLQSPTVEAYKKQQKAVVDAQKAAANAAAAVDDKVAEEEAYKAKYTRASVFYGA